MAIEIFEQPEASDETEVYRVPEWGYVSQLMTQLQWESQGFHQKFSDLEALKYYEDYIGINPEERRSGQEVHIGLTADLLENVKAALLANMPRVRFEGLRRKEGVEENQSKREKYWQAELDSMGDVISEVVDSQLLGLGVLKTALQRDIWSSNERRRRKGEKDEDYVDRVTAYKKLWGPPIGRLSVHPLAFYFRPGKGAVPEECIEQGYVAKRKVLKQWTKLSASTQRQSMRDMVPNEQVDELGIVTTPTQPNEFIRPLPMGLDTTQYFTVTQYWNPECYQVYVNQELVYQETGPPSVKYLIAPGRTSSSKDPDKIGISVAEGLRVMEPVLNLMMTRMVEALDLIVRKRNTLEVPESYTPELEEYGNGETRPKQFEFTAEYADTLPPGAKLVDAYQGAEAAFQGMALLQLLMQVVGQHGVTPLFKGISPGAAGSGYRDNSLYLMAKQQFQYIILSLQGLLREYIEYGEWLIAYKLKQEVFQGEIGLSPNDIRDWPAKVTVELKPTLPQNRIAEGEFGMGQVAAGAITMRRHREEFLGIEQPDEEDIEVDLEQMKSMTKPYLFMELMQTTMGLGQPEQPSGLVDQSGNPLASSPPPRNPMDALGGGGQTLTGRSAQRGAGFATGGQPKSPAQEPGALPKRTMENA